MNRSLISDVLVDAYTSTNYVVESKPNFTLRVGSQCEELARIYEKANVSTACFITAYNPFSVLLTTPHNVARQAELLNEIAAFKLKFVFGYGQSNDSEWKEPSVLILGITYDQSMELAVKHEQNAFIWCDETATPELVLTR
jgi:hypothetical protein